MKLCGKSGKNYMRKMIVATVILSLIFAGWMWEENKVRSICDRAVDSLEIIEEKLSDKDAALAEVFKFEKNWHRDERWLDVITPHDNTDVINVEVVRLLYHVETGNRQSAVLALREIEEYITETKRKVKVNLTNIF